jgi:hypothetical protein
MMMKANSLVDVNGWLSSDCNAFIWSAKFATLKDATVKIEAAEYPDQPGRLSTKPFPSCAQTWSREAAIGGLFPYALGKHDLKLLERHAAFGNASKWKMGDAPGEASATYLPSTVSTLYSLIYALGGENNPARGWPSYFEQGQVGLEAYIQVMSIWLRGAIDDKKPTKPNGTAIIDSDEGLFVFGDDRFRLAEITEVMYMRLREHAQTEPDNPFFQFVFSLYDSGDISQAVDLLIRADHPIGSYVVCQAEDNDGCKVAEWLWLTNLILEASHG